MASVVAAGVLAVRLTTTLGMAFALAVIAAAIILIQGYFLYPDAKAGMTCCRTEDDIVTVGEGWTVLQQADILAA